MEPKLERKTLRIVVSGDQEVGKSAITNIITHTKELFDCYTPTIGVEYKTRYIFGRDIKLAFWDLSGDKRFEKITLPYVTRYCLVLFVYDINNFESARKISELNDLYRLNGWEGTGIVVCTTIGVEERSSHYNIGYGKNFAEEHGYNFFKVNIDSKNGMQELETGIFKTLELDKENQLRTQRIVREKTKKNFKQQVVDCVCGKKCFIM